MTTFQAEIKEIEELLRKDEQLPQGAAKKLSCEEKYELVKWKDALQEVVDQYYRWLPKFQQIQ